VFIGLLAAAYSLMQFVFAPLLGLLSDERGRRPIITLSLAGCTVAWLVFGLGAQFEPVPGVAGALAALFAVRMRAGAVGGNIATAKSVLADVTPVEEPTGALGLVGAIFALRFVLGPALGAVVASDAAMATACHVLHGFVPATQFSLPNFLAAGRILVAVVAAGCSCRNPIAVATPSSVGAT